MADLFFIELSELYYTAHYIFDDCSSFQESKELLQIKMKKIGSKRSIGIK